MEWLIVLGAIMTLVGVAGIAWCILRVRRARAAALDEAALRATLQRVIAVNLGALGLSAIGLGAVVTGILLG